MTAAGIFSTKKETPKKSHKQKIMSDAFMDEFESQNQYIFWWDCHCDSQTNKCYLFKYEQNTVLPEIVTSTEDHAGLDEARFGVFQRQMTARAFETARVPVTVRRV